MKLFCTILLATLVLLACDRPAEQTSVTTTEVKLSSVNDSILKLLNEKIKNDPNNYLNYLERAKFYGSVERYDLAFQDIDRAKSIDSTKSEIYLFKGNLNWDRQEVKLAYEDFKTCLTYESKNIDCLLKKAGIDIALRNYELAIEHINTALKQNEYLPYAYYLKGRLYKDTKDTTLAVSSYQTAVQVDPEYYDAYIELGLLYAARKHELAKEYYNTAIEVKPKSIEAWYNKAIFLQENGTKNKNYYNEAFACYDSIIAIDPKFSAAYFNKGFINLEYLFNYEAGAQHFTEAINQFPEYYQAYYNRGLCLESLGKKQEAADDYRAALKINPKYDEAALSLSRVLGK